MNCKFTIRNLLAVTATIAVTCGCIHAISLYMEWRADLHWPRTQPCAYCGGDMRRESASENEASYGHVCEGGALDGKRACMSVFRPVVDEHGNVFFGGRGNRRMRMFRSRVTNRMRVSVEGPPEI